MDNNWSEKEGKQMNAVRSASLNRIFSDVPDQPIMPARMMISPARRCDKIQTPQKAGMELRSDAREVEVC